MAGRGPAPKPAAERRTAHKPQRGEWTPTPGFGWQHGAIPDAPATLTPVALEAWRTWMQSWVASNWTPQDLPGLRVAVQLLDECERYFADPYVERETRKGDVIYVLRPNPAGELRQYLDNYGITPKGQQDRRWTKPAAEVAPKAAPDTTPTPYAHLRIAQ